MDLTLTATAIVEGRAKRLERIEEAKSWPVGKEERIPQTIWTGGNFAVALEKPGKEATRQKRPNPNDMRPVLTTKGVAAKSISFGGVFYELMQVQPKSEASQLLGVLLIRSAYMADHSKDAGGHWRYYPSSEAIAAITAEIPQPYGVSVEAFLHYLDILAWNEDVKYSTFGYLPDKGWGDGRENTLLTCANVVAAHIGFVDFAALMDAAFRGRGICAISRRNAHQYFHQLGPYENLPRKRRQQSQLNE